MIYFLQRDDGMIKIGTTKNYHKRLSDLIREHGDLTLLGLMEGDRDVEAGLHHTFSEFREGRTEFFEPAKGVLEFIDNFTNVDLPERVPLGFSARIAVTPEAKARMKDFVSGLDDTYDAALVFLLERIATPGNEFITGRTLQTEFQEWKAANYDIGSSKDSA